jgi:UDP-N-acetylmuramyl pentapeptide phosphotransferase/UDP-N-acetylglucosamine-1-phosphate transferase
MLPFANFILDTTFTFFRRLIRREKWYQAHRSHIYQRMTDLGMTHKRVTSIELLAGIACGGLWVWGKEPRNRDVHGNSR